MTADGNDKVQEKEFTIMAGGFIPTKNQIVRVAVAMVIVFAAIRFLPVPDNLRAMFRV